MLKTNRPLLSMLGSPAVLIILLAVGFATYHYALVDIPRRDHIIYLAERAYVGSDWDWFWHSVSLSRSRYIAPGDYYLFRPLHMAVLVVRDILFRDNLYACGSVNVLMASVAGFSLYSFSRRLIKPVLAVALAALFMVQYAGMEMVAWGHISPYMLAMAFFGLALTELIKEEGGSLKRAALFMVLGSLVHEVVVVMLVAAAFVVLMIRLMAGKGATAGGIRFGRYLVWVFALPVVVYAALDLFDYVYHGTHSVLGPGDLVMPRGDTSAISALLSVPGAAATAFVAPFLVKLEPVKNDVLKWDFGSLRMPVIVFGAALAMALAAALFLCVRALYKGRGTRVTLPTVMIIFMFAGTTMGIGIGRVVMRGIEYFYGATYYYSITAYIFCLLVAIAMHRLAGEGPFRRTARRAVMVLVALLIVINFVLASQALKAQWPERREYAEGLNHYKELLGPRMKQYCLMGSEVMFLNLDTYSILLRDYFCLPGDGRTPGYVTEGEDGVLWLSRLRKLPFGSSGGSAEVPLASAGPFLLGSMNYDRPDIALTAQVEYNTGIMFSYHGPGDFLMFMIKGPLVSAHKMKGGGIGDLQLVGLPGTEPVYHAEVRHSGDNIYLFVGEYLVASMPSAEETPGKVGLFPWPSGGPPGTYSSFRVTASTDSGGFAFEPMVRLGGD